MIKFILDDLGNKVVIGDRVVVAPPEQRGEVVVAKVTKISPKGVRVYVEGRDHPDLRGSRSFHRLNFIKLDAD